MWKEKVFVMFLYYFDCVLDRLFLDFFNVVDKEVWEICVLVRN